MPSDRGPPESAAPDRRRALIIYGALMLGMFMASLDNQIVVTALPTIAGDLGGMEYFAWVGTGYLLTSSATMPLYGKLGDQFGRKPLLICAVGLFLLGSAACAFAHSMVWLVGARLLQGLGAGGVMVTIFATIADIFPPRDRSRYLGYSTTVFLVASVAGPVLGGLFTQTIGWRWIFIVNIPIGAAVIGIVWVMMPAKPPATRPQVDVAGAVLLAMAVSALVLLAYAGGRMLAPWVLLTLGLVAVAAILGWIAAERRAAEPIWPLSLFGDSTFVICCIIGLVGGLASLGILQFVALFLQVVLGASPTVAGLLFLPGTATMVVTSNLVGFRMARTGQYKWYPVVGMVFTAISIVIMLRLGPGNSYWGMVFSMLAFGVGLGLIQQVLLAAVQNAVERRHIGAATGALNLARIAGATLGLAAYGGIFAFRLPTALQAAGAAGLGENVTPDMIAALEPALRHAVATAYGDALGTVFHAVLPLLILGLIASLLLKPLSLSTRQRE